MLPRYRFARYLVAFILAVIAGCALATPFQPNANASNTASNTATASPATSVTLHPATPAAQPPQPTAPNPAQSQPAG